MIAERGKMNCIECRYKLSTYQVCKDCNKKLNSMNQSLKESFEKLLLELNQLKELEQRHLDTIHHRNMQIKELNRYKDLSQQILNMSNIHGVYRDDTDCLNAIREAIYRRLNNR